MGGMHSGPCTSWSVRRLLSLAAGLFLLPAFFSGCFLGAYPATGPGQLSHTGRRLKAQGDFDGSLSTGSAGPGVLPAGGLKSFLPPPVTEPFSTTIPTPVATVPLIPLPSKPVPVKMRVTSHQGGPANDANAAASTTMSTQYLTNRLTKSSSWGPSQIKVMSAPPTAASSSSLPITKFSRRAPTPFVPVPWSMASNLTTSLKPNATTSNRVLAASGRGRSLLQSTETPHIVSGDFIKRGNTIYAHEVTVTTDTSYALTPGVHVLRSDTDIMIQAYKVTLLPSGLEAQGKNITIIAAELQCQGGPSKASCLLNVSGRDAARPDPEQAPNGPDGFAGSAGCNGFDAGIGPSDGGHGGSIKLHIGAYHESIINYYRGGDGSYGQIGGNGGKGSEPPRAPSQPCDESRSIFLGCVGGYAWSTQYLCSRCMWYEYSGLPGHKGGKGGDAGANGANGNGGNIGSIKLIISKFIPSTGEDVYVVNRAGRGGQQRKTGSPGLGGPGGLGACPSKANGTCPIVSQIAYGCRSCGLRTAYAKAVYGARGPRGDSGSVPVLLPDGKDGEEGSYSGIGANGFVPVRDWRDADTEPEFLSMLLSKARDNYISGEQQQAADLGMFVKSLSSSCTAANFDACQQVGSQATAMLYKLSQGHSFYGTPPGWVSTLSLNWIQNFLKQHILPSLELMEGAQKNLLDKTADQNMKHDAILDVQKQLTDNVQGLKAQIDQIAVDYSRNLESLNLVLGPARSKYQRELVSAWGSFQEAMKQKAANDRMWLIFNTVADCVGMFSSVMSFGITARGDATKALSMVKDVMKGLKEVTADVNALVKTPVELTNLAVLADTSPEGAAAAYGQVRSEAGEKAMLLVDKARFDKLLSAYMDLEAGHNYKRAMAGFVAATQNYNEVLYQMSHQLANRFKMQSDIVALDAQLSKLQVKKTSISDPTVHKALAAAAECKRQLQDLALYNLFLQQAAVSYLQVQDVPLMVADLSHANLDQLNTQFYGDIQKWIEGQKAVAQKTIFKAIILNADTLPGFQGMLAAKQITFAVGPCNFRGYSDIRVEKVNVSVKGVRPLLYPYASTIKIYMDHPGRADVYRQDGSQAAFTHIVREAIHEYDVVSNSIMSQGAFSNDAGTTDEFSATYIKVSPITVWQLGLPPDVNSEVDVSGVTEISAIFWNSQKNGCRCRWPHLPTSMRG